MIFLSETVLETYVRSNYFSCALEKLQDNLLRTFFRTDAAAGTFILVNVRDIVCHMHRVKLTVLFA